jgi:hypothetical protein
MPGPQPISINLTDRQRVILERLAHRQTVPKRLAGRASIILQASCGGSNAQIAQRLELSRSAVYTWRKRWLIAAPRLTAYETKEIDDEVLTVLIKAVLDHKLCPETFDTFPPEVGVAQNEIVRKWWNDIEKDASRLLPQVNERMKKIREEMTNVVIWLGGPGRDHQLYSQRSRIREVLERENFKVIFSEDYQGGSADLASKEVEEIRSSNLVMILAITAGASGEAIECAYLEPHKLYVYIPTEYKNGYIFNTLCNRHRVANENCLFSLEGLKQNNSELALKVVSQAITHRNELYRQAQTARRFNTP